MMRALKELLPATRSEEQRQAERRVIRQQLAEMTLKRARLAELQSQMIELDRRADAAADRHHTICEPAQDQLATVEARILKALTDRTPLDTADEIERSEVIAKLSEANEALERETAVLKSLRRPLEIDRQRLGIEAAGYQGLENKLASEKLGNPDLLDKLFLAQRRITGCDARRCATRRGIEVAEANISIAKQNQDPEMLANAQRQLRRWHMEKEAAENDSASAIAEADAIHRQLIDE